MTVSALDIITNAAKKIGVVFKSEALDADEANDGLIALNDMLDTWSNDDLATVSDTLESFPLTTAASYTIGTGGNFNTSRPLNISSVVVRVGSIDYTLLPITLDQYQEDIPLKSIQSPIPKFYNYDNGYPLGTFRIYYVTNGGTLYLQSSKPLSNLSALTTVIDLPPGWKRALIYNLAIELAPEYGVEVSASVQSNAKTSLGAIKRSTAINNAMPLMTEDIRQGNIFSGWYS